MAADRKRLTCDEYHVAWICPVADLELLPARLMLDEEYDPPQYDTHYDENAYIFGSIHNHAVVIATCPRGRTGNVNAGRLSYPMFKTFTKIRMALLVGIGGGIPSPQIFPDPLKNIHLGDVVVGYCGDGKPSCVYHERGRSKINGEFEIVGQVQDPDWRLTNALDILISDRDMGLTTFHDQLARLQRHEDGSRFAHPGLAHDNLFEARYEHIGDYYTRCRECDRDKLVVRPPRSPNSQHTLVFHHGRIATGNAVIQNGEKRDKIRSRCDGALCVEMEAAGVDSSKPCLVIRGISDYADSHKSDVWRDHAAGKAAVFARELLCKVPSNINEQTTHRMGREEEVKQSDQGTNRAEEG
jgi:nucleoside phosphorylase